MSAQVDPVIVKITNQKDGKPGHLYCAVVVRENLDDANGATYDSFEGLYWLGADGELYARNGVLSEDDIEPSHPDYDYLLEQAFAFDASYAK